MSAWQLMTPADLASGLSQIANASPSMQGRQHGPSPSGSPACCHAAAASSSAADLDAQWLAGSASGASSLLSTPGLGPMLPALASPLTPNSPILTLRGSAREGAAERLGMFARAVARHGHGRGRLEGEVAAAAAAATTEQEEETEEKEEQTSAASSKSPLVLKARADADANPARRRRQLSTAANIRARYLQSLNVLSPANTGEAAKALTPREAVPASPPQPFVPAEFRPRPGGAGGGSGASYARREGRSAACTREAAHRSAAARPSSPSDMSGEGLFHIEL